MAPTLITTAILLLYFYLRDNNREPWQRLVESFALGFALSLQVGYLQQLIPWQGLVVTAFVSAALIEEAVKLAVLKVTLFRSPDFTQKIDGITYAVFLGLGFALAENLTHVSLWEIGMVRAFTAVPAHALFGVSMGFWLGMYRFRAERWMLGMALAIPVLLHGVYNLLLMTDSLWGLVLFVPFTIFLWVKGVARMEALRKKVQP